MHVASVAAELCVAFRKPLAWLVYDALKIRRKTIDENLAFAFPERSQTQRQVIARSMWRHLFLMVVEAAHVPRKIHDTNWRDYVRVSDEDCFHNVAMMLDDRSCIMVSGHYGNFEVGGVVSGLLGFPTYTVARPLDNRYLHEFVNSFRGATGQFILPKKESASQIDAVLHAGGTIVLLGDQAAGPKGCWVDFFGRPASCHKAVALFSLVNRAPMMLVYAERSGELMQFTMGVRSIFDPNSQAMGVKELTQWYSSELEAVVRQHPEQYWWLHRRWKAKPVRNGRRRMDPSQDRAEPHAHGKSAETTVLNQLDTHRQSQANQAPDQHPLK
ncbi:MAG: lysophospholipid acyltransferase family protein [Pirellulaceae bacterium]